MSANKKENFERIAEARTNKIIHYIGLLGNLSNRSYYEYSQKEIESIFDAIQKELDLQKRKFSNTTNKEQKFRL